MRPEYLVALGERMGEREMEDLEEFGLSYTAGDLPPWLYRLWLSTQTVPLYKSAEKEGIRPIGIRHTLPWLFHSEVISQSKTEIREFLEPQQLGQSLAGGAKLVLCISGMLEANPNFVCVSTDIENCYNTQNRAAALHGLQGAESLSHLTTFAATILAPVPALETRGKVWGSTGTGKIQGDSASGPLQAVGFQPSVEILDAECSVGGGVARAGADDVFAVGPPEIVIPAIQRFAAEVEERCSLRLQWSKSTVYTREGGLPDNTPAGLSLAGEQVGEQFLRGTMVYGVPVGCPEYITFKLREKAEEIISDANKTREVLATDPQALWTALRLSVQQRFQYLMQLTPPSLCEPVAAELDTAFYFK